LIQASESGWIVQRDRQTAKSRFHPKMEAAEAWASMEQSVHEQGDQDDDRDRYAEEKQQ